MLIISLDESGNFEKPGKKPPFIGGLLFEGDEEDIKRERERILTFFQKVCAETGAEFPKDLHYDLSSSNKEICSVVKTEYVSHLGEFLHLGTYKGEMICSERTGKYTLLLDIYRKDNRSGQSGLLADNVNSNRYEQMVEDYLRYFVFLNPAIQSLEPCFELPTRITDKKMMENVDNSAIVKKIGANGEARNDQAEVMNKSTYRTLIRTLIKDYHIEENDFHVSSIYYGGNRTEQRNQAFLYLCDALCTLFLQKVVSDEASYEEIYQRLEDLSLDNKPMVLFYGDEGHILESYRYAYEEALKGNVIQSLKERGKILSNNSEEGVFFQNHWVYNIDKKLNQELSSYNQKMLNKLMADLEDCTKQIKDVQLYSSAFTYLEIRVNELIGENGWDTESTLVAEMLYRLYDAGVALFNHEGMAEKSHEYIQKMSRLSEYVEDERLKNDCVNRHTVNLIDRMMFNEAFLLSKTVAAKTGKESNKGKRGYVPTVSRARALSQFAQVCAFINEYNSSLSPEDISYYGKMAESFFLNSLDLWKELKDEDNYYITLCYYLHYLVSIADNLDDDATEEIKALRKRYMERSAEYFYGETTPRRQLEALITRDKDLNGRNFAHSVFIWIKGSLMFYPIDQVKAALREENLCAILDRATEGHPWELIYYYLAEACFLSGKKDKAEETFKCCLLQNAKTQTQPILQSIVYSLILRYLELTGETDGMDEWENQLYQSVQSVTGGRLPKQKEESRKVITYAYS